MKKSLLLVALLFSASMMMSQVKIGDNIDQINSNSLLELESTDQGVLLPRLELVMTTDPTPLSEHVKGMIVYNTVELNDVVEGIYWNDGTKWQRVSGPIAADNDSDPTNEIQTISIDGTTVTLDKNGGTFDIPAEVDGDVTNEIQTISLIGNTVTLDREGGSFEIPAEVDGDVTNEIQTISISGNTVTLDKNGGTFDIPAEVDGDVMNEIQTISISGNTVTLDKNGGTFDIPAEVDGDVTNEIQTISISGNTVTLDKNGGTFDIPAEVDGDVTNEIQTISISGNTVTLDKNGGSFTVPQDGDAWNVAGEDIASNILRNGKATIKNAGSSSDIAISAPSASKAGLLEFHDPDGSRNGFIGWETGKMYYAADKSIHHFGGSNPKVGINEGAPTARLDVNGDVRIRSIAAGATSDQVLSVNTDGYVRKINVTDVQDGDAWGVSGEDITSNIHRTGNVNIGASNMSNRNIANLNVYSGALGTIASFRGRASSSEILFQDLESSNWPAALSNLGTTSDGFMIVAPQSSNLVFKSRGNDATDGFHFLSGDGTHVMTINDNKRVGIGTNSPTQKLHVMGNILASGTITGSSDERLKTNINPVKNALDKVMSVNGVTWEWKNPENHGAVEGQKVSGVVAQEIEKVMPELVTTAEDEMGTKSVNYDGIIAYLIEAMKEQQQEIEGLKLQIEELKAK